jgi:predicted site-specific integrase-resolvase
MTTEAASTITKAVHYAVTDLAWTGLSVWTWRRWAYDGKIASVKAGKRLLIPASEVERIMREGLRPALAASGVAR